ncbi:MAG: hypothetical protein UT72_C0020G0007 [Candidatus Woesebacteria bacterium GW2011_GWB1_40_101]|uniref:Glycosyltransferase RgtA/B/C/D-like domain-containing protein n=1 Tax=Candidatus Woesebacteria bacterium GW2011_GWB1_40_101 TaxID=1618575 RepID=A0A0G0SU82_9BACT|nr:MAG: hypothetical protein UT72_C0020G0007 [Candidatus Woesebacteria bacterium GW2011_GWB1_40_101]
MILIILVLIITVHILILSKLIFFPYLELFVYPYLTNHGLIPYRDILDQHFPGLMFFPINLDNLGMTTPTVARYWQYGIVILTHTLLFFVARKVFKSNLKALIVNFLYLIWQPFFEGWALWIDSFLPILLLPAFYFTYVWEKNRKSKFIFLAGLFLGLGLLFKQVMIVLIGFVFLYVLFKSKSIKKIIPFGLGLAIPVLFLVVYVLKLGVWDDFVYWTLTFNLTTFADFGRKYPEMTLLLRTIFVFLPALLVWRKNFLNFVFLIGSLVFVYARFDFVHLQPALPFAVMGTVYAFDFVWTTYEKKILILPYFLGTILILFKFYQGYIGNRIFFFGEEEKAIVNKVVSLSRPTDKVFAFGTPQHLYQTARRLPPGNIFVFQFPWFMMEAEGRVFSGILNDPPKVVVRDKLAEVDGKNLMEYMPNIVKYIDQNYKVIDKVGNSEILVPK